MNNGSSIQLSRAKRLKAARIEAGFKTAAGFADFLQKQNVGIVDTTYRSYENATRNITMEAAKKLAPFLNVRWEWLIDGDNTNKESYNEELMKKSIYAALEFSKSHTITDIPELALLIYQYTLKNRASDSSINPNKTVAELVWLKRSV